MNNFDPTNTINFRLARENAKVAWGNEKNSPLYKTAKWISASTSCASHIARGVTVLPLVSGLPLLPTRFQESLAL
ncbi:MAG: hypothetical protein SP4CHLAM5_04470 [Chlamydiia bacterium]|nr:hypothetical protein [Chlamydiia bacterium]MCH9618320.1 hypothetical protein [Chlamydiia bacterium]MCH9624492.1 hypothetical protein [Chlamydiia bacterium]